MQLLLLDVLLVADQDEADLLVRIMLGLLQPPRYILEGVLLRDVVDDQPADRASVVGPSDRFEGFLARLYI